MFNSATDDDFKREVKNVFSVPQILNSVHYLCLPTIWGRSRKDALSFLKERIRDNMLSWRNRMLNNTGKEVLFKSVVTVLPAHVMSVFKLPTTWYEEVNSMIPKF